MTLLVWMRGCLCANGTPPIEVVPRRRLAFGCLSVKPTWGSKVVSGSRDEAAEKPLDISYTHVGLQILHLRRSCGRLFLDQGTQRVRYDLFLQPIWRRGVRCDSLEGQQTQVKNGRMKTTGKVLAQAPVEEAGLEAHVSRRTCNTDQRQSDVVHSIDPLHVPPW